MDWYLHFSHLTLQRLKRVQSLIDRLSPEGAPEALIIPGSPPPRDSIIVCTGSFNPPTIAHLALLKQARRYARQHEPMHLYAAMSKRTVDKEKVERPLLLDRVTLLNTLLQARIPQTGILLFNRGLYVEQAQGIRSSFPKVKRIFFLMGYDKIVQILDPHYYEDRDSSLHELFSLAELLVAPRGNDGARELATLLQQQQNEPFARYIHLLPLSSAYRNISSTSVREGNNGSTAEIPQEVEQFIRETRAYAPPLRGTDGSEIDYYAERVKALNELLHQ